MKATLSLLFSVLLLIGFLAGGFYLIQYVKNMKGKENTQVVTSTTTTTIENHVDTLLPDAAACETDDDCILSQITPVCGCHYVINKHFDPSKLEAAVTNFQQTGQSCGTPQIQCQAAPKQEYLKCISGKCDIVRPTIDPARTFSDDPKELESQIKSLLINANYCAADDNCMVADLDAGCPFGCYNLVSKNADLSFIKEGLAKYQSSGAKACTYKCMAAPQASDIKCVKNKCLDMRTSN